MYFNSFNSPMVYVTNSGRSANFDTMDCVVIQNDTLNLGLPVGETGFITTVLDHKSQSAFDYIVRVPSKKEFYAVPECDLIEKEKYVSSNVERVINESLINHALDTGNAILFKMVVEKQSDSV